MVSQFNKYSQDQFGQRVVLFLRSHPLHFYKAGHFSPSFRLSQAHVELEPLKYHTTAARIFNINSVEQYKEKIATIPDRVWKLFALFEDQTIDLSFATHTTNEKETFKLITKSILLKLGDVVLDKHQFGATDKDNEYDAYPNSESASSISKSSSKSFKSDWLGIGTDRTWHGYPDARFRIGKNDTTLLTHDDPKEQETPGDSIAIEAKLQLNADRLMQLVPTTVVSAFIEKNLHEDLYPMIPSIMMTPTRALICIYDVKRDYLLISDTFQWLEKEDGQDTYVFNKSGFFLLWLALNHRECLCDFQPLQRNIDLTSSIKQNLVLYGRYEDFNKLRNKRTRFVNYESSKDCNIGEEVQIRCEPQPKRQKLM